MREALPVFGRKIKGYDMPDAVLTGVETRTSSPLRIPRGDDLQSLNVRGLYPQAKGRVMPAASSRPAWMASRWPKPWRRTWLADRLLAYLGAGGFCGGLGGGGGGLRMMRGGVSTPGGTGSASAPHRARTLAPYTV